LKDVVLFPSVKVNELHKREPDEDPDIVWINYILIFNITIW
jgi:hypothetical protein